MKTKLVEMLLSALLSMLSPALLVEFVDMGLDWIEDKVKDTSNDLDDKLVLPLCNTIRTAFNIPDDDA